MLHLPADGLCQQHDAADFQTAGRGTGAAAKEQEHKDDSLTETWPCGVIRGSETGSGNDGGYLKKGVTDSITRAVHRGDIEGDDTGSHHNDGKEANKLMAAQRGAPLSHDNKEKQIEIDGKEHHEEGDNPLTDRGVASHAAV